MRELRTAPVTRCVPDSLGSLLRGVFCVIGLRAYRVPRSRVARRFGRLCGLSPTTVPRSLATPGSSSHELHASSEPAVPEPPRASTHEALPWGFCPLRDVSWKSHRNETEHPRSTSAPPTGFLTLSTVYSSPSLAGLFHPAATSGVRSSGVFPAAQPERLVAAPCPPGVARPSPALRCQRAPDPIPRRLQGVPPRFSPLRSTRG